MLDALIASIRFFQFFQVVDQWERGVVLRLGRFHREIGPGLAWIVPLFVDRVWTITVVADPEKLEEQTLTTEDGKVVTLRAVVTFRVVDVRKALLDVTTVKRSLEDACSGEIGRLVSEERLENLTAKRFWTKLTKACHERGAEWGIAIERVQLSDIAVSKNFRLWSGHAPAGA